ncbi:CBS domain-containing protein [Streptomyces coeruleoprunus]|uniref:CBS domain-containing protein n=1 Tax=Streptomyces coeruleoprunus TaxID=285563 RepID=A0ABV9XEY8_9ACTN
MRQHTLEDRIPEEVREKVPDDAPPEVPERIPDDIPPTEAPDDVPPAQVPDDVPPTRVPDDVPEKVPDDVPIRIPDDPPAETAVPARGEVPTTGVTGEVPVLTRRTGEVMRSSVVTVASAETVLIAWELLERARARYLPVVLADGRCAGVLERSEVAVACAGPAVALSRRAVVDLLRGRRCVVVHRDDPVRRAVNVMNANGCEALPVVGEGGRFAGLLTASDIVSALAGHPAGEGPGGDEDVPYPYPVTPGLAPRRAGVRVTPVP